MKLLLLVLLAIAGLSSQTCKQGPTIPTELRATAVGAGALNISWRSSCFVRTEIQFSLIAVNLNYSRRTPDMIHRILNLHYTYNITDETSCDVYSIRVTSSNGSISSNVSDSIITSFPSLPDISPLVNSLQHSLFKRSDGVMLTFWFNDASFCPRYSILNYTVVLDNAMGHRITKAVNNAASRFALLKPDSRYSFKIMVTNSVGTVKANESLIYTTDVQAVSLNRVGINTYSIRCHYLNNSDVTGCMYVLVSELEELKNITGVIDRNNAEGAIYDLADIGCYDDLLAYGYHDEDGRTGNLPIVLETDLRVCRITSEGDNFLLAYAILIVHVFGLSAIVIFTLGFFFYMKQHGYLVGVLNVDNKLVQRVRSSFSRIRSRHRSLREEPVTREVSDLESDLESEIHDESVAAMSETSDTNRRREESAASIYTLAPEIPTASPSEQTASLTLPGKYDSDVLSSRMSTSGTSAAGPAEKLSLASASETILAQTNRLSTPSGDLRSSKSAPISAEKLSLTSASETILAQTNFSTPSGDLRSSKSS